MWLIHRSSVSLIATWEVWRVTVTANGNPVDALHHFVNAIMYSNVWICVHSFVNFGTFHPFLETNVIPPCICSASLAHNRTRVLHLPAVAKPVQLDVLLGAQHMTALDVLMRHQPHSILVHSDYMWILAYNILYQRLGIVAFSRAYSGIQFYYVLCVFFVSLDFHSLVLSGFPSEGR